MGITVISSTAVNAASPSPATSVTGEATPAGDFAALLVQQLLGAAPATGTAALTAPQQATQGKDEETETPADPLAAGDGTAIVPFLLPGIDTRSAAQTAVQGDPGQAFTQAATAAVGQQAGKPLDTSPFQAPTTPALETPAISAEGGNKAAESAKFAVPLAPATDNTGNFAALASQAAAVTQPAARGEPSAHPAPPTPNTPVGAPSWGKDFGDSVLWMSRNNLQSAQISLNPPHLGPVQITLNVVGDQATAVFASPHAEVRQAISDAMPQLRDMLAGSGINLGQANVGAQLQQQARQDAPQTSGSGRFADDNAILQGTSAVGDANRPSPVNRGRGLVDLFA